MDPHTPETWEAIVISILGAIFLKITDIWTRRSEKKESAGQKELELIRTEQREELIRLNRIRADLEHDVETYRDRLHTEQEKTLRLERENEKLSGELEKMARDRNYRPRH